MPEFFKDTKPELTDFDKHMLNTSLNWDSSPTEKSLQIPCGFTNVTLLESNVRQIQEAIICHLPSGTLRSYADAIVSYFVMNCMKEK